VDDLAGGGAAATLWARDGVTDTVSGGSGADSAQVDAALDVVSLVEALLP
jgi:hypothetical protein